MCMIDYADGEWVSFGGQMRSARKQHVCVECGRTIELGEQYEYATGFDKEIGSYEHFKTCRHCVAVRLWLQKVCGGFLYCGVFEDLDEHRRETNYNPRWLNIAVSGMKRRWRGKDGSLRRPMTLPKRLPIPEHQH